MLYPAGGPAKVTVKTFSKVCEKGRTDQSPFNQQIRGNCLRLPYGYSVIPTRWRKPPPVLDASALGGRDHALHRRPQAVGDAVTQRSGPANPIHAVSVSSKLWVKACAPLAVDPIETSLRINVLAAQLLGRWV